MLLEPSTRNFVMLGVSCGGSSSEDGVADGEDWAHERSAVGKDPIVEVVVNTTPNASLNAANVGFFNIFLNIKTSSSRANWVAVCCVATEYANYPSYRCYSQWLKNG
ncbi:MAG: hypothetical protein WBG66_14760 [Geitlerinemataceae cyanobacterium]